MENRSEAHNRAHPNSSLIVLIVVIVAVLCVPTVLFRSLTDHLANDITQKISLQFSQELNAQMSSNVSNSLKAYFNDLELVYHTMSLIEDPDIQKMQSFIGNVKQSEDISYFAFADDEGIVYEADGFYLGTMRLRVLGDLLNGEKRLISDNETVNGQSYILFGTYFDEPIIVEGHRICIGIFGVTNDDLAQSIILNNQYSGGFTSIILQNGSFVIKNPSETHEGLNAFTILQRNGHADQSQLAAIKTAMASEDSYILSIHTGSDITEYLYFAPITGTDWYAVNTLPRGFIRSNIVDLQNGLSVATLLLVTFLITAGAVVFLLQSSSQRKLHRSQEELARALQAAEKASAAKTSFLFSMSHDIRTPMNAILGYTDIGLNHLGDAELSATSFHKIKSAGAHLLRLINDILELSRIESGKLELSAEPLNILQAIEAVDTMSQTLAVSKSIDFTTVIGEIPDPYIYADELHINEVIINLISNAVKYTPNGGKVTYSVNQIGQETEGVAKYRFEIADTGIGMSEEFLEHIFEAFSREASTAVAKTEGSGIGLSIVKKIVDLAGGEISVQSERDKGTVFTVDIPFRVMDAEAITRFQQEHSEKPVTEVEDSFLQGKRVLLVDDNEINREIATYILEDVGITVETAEDGMVAVETFAGRNPEYFDFILMDIQMPVMNGYDATKAIRKLPEGKRIPIIALSANAFEEDKKKSLACGMNAHIAKPIEVPALLEAIRSFVH